MNLQIPKEKLELWADYLLNYSLDGVKPDDIIMVKGENICWPLISVLQDKIFAAGGIADINIVAPDNDRGKVWGASIARHGTAAQICRVPLWMVERYETMTKYIEILGVDNPENFSGMDPSLHQSVMKADEPIKNIRLAKPWVLTLYPTSGFAEIEGMSLEQYADVIVSASTVDPVYLEEVEEDIYSLMQNSSTVTIETRKPGSDEILTLVVNIEGCDAVKCTGKRNFPDGEVFTSPVTNSTEGEIYVDLPVFQGGTTIQGIYLRFENGKIIEYSAETGYEALAKIIETDEGSHRLGEVALGMNNGITKVLKHPLFVEKVGATLHIAIGASYPECFHSMAIQKSELISRGIQNISAQHVDIVADFRKGGAGYDVYLDDVKLKIENGIWVVP
ncbi:MAG: aminopeptidase [Ignavibacteriales bacterium]|nr:aminopeptidase [Ignavibacteriales bacterium]MCF8437387.1 aminopeptidase [Ignavibacteriales bacterium]